jgi:hypothetical protein
MPRAGARYAHESESGLDEADVQSLIQVLGGKPLLQPDDRARIERYNALELFPRLRSGTVVC